MRSARTCPWIRMRPYRVPLRGQGVFFAAQSSAGCITNTSGFDLRQAQLKVIINEIEDIQTRIAGLETQVLAWHNSSPVSQRLATIPGIGPIIATAIAATVADPSIFCSGREF